MSTANVTNTLIIFGGGETISHIIDTCLKKDFVKKNNVAIRVKSKNSAEKWRKEGFLNVFINIQEVFEKYPTSTFVIVKPKVFEEMIAVWPANCKPSRIISMMPEYPLALLKSKLAFLANSTSIIRVITNIACSIGAASSILCHQPENIETEKSDIEYAKTFAGCLGTVEIVPEKNFNPAMAIAGSSPAWLLMMLESLVDGGVAQGMERAQAKRIAAQAMLGTAKVLLTQESGFKIETMSIGRIREHMCSPGGPAVEGARELEKHAFRSTIIEAVAAATGKAAEKEIKH